MTADASSSQLVLQDARGKVRPRHALVAGVAAVALVASVLVRPATSGAQTSVIADIRADADWILSAQLPDGAIANYVDKLAVWPYLSNFAAMGLARATEVTGDPAYADASWRWLAWYQAHMDAQGFVEDYLVVGGLPVATGFKDSTDAYAGTFLMAIRMTYRAKPDRDKLRALKPGIANAVRAIEATQVDDGLTWAKPEWKVKYLMDQAETWAGLLAGAELARVLGDTALADRAKQDSDRMKAGVDGLWNASVGAYDWAKHESGVRQVNDWSLLYSDALQQTWAVAFGMVEPLRANALMSRFNTSQPNWSRPASTALFSGGLPELVGYWPITGLGYSLLKSPLAFPAMSSIRSGIVMAKRAWPFTTGNAGQMILFQSYSPALSMLSPLPRSLSKVIGSVTTPTTTTVAAAQLVAGTAAPVPAPPMAKPPASRIAAVPPAPSAPAPPAPAPPPIPPPTPLSTPPPLVSANVAGLGVRVSLSPLTVTIATGGAP